VNRFANAVARAAEYDNFNIGDNFSNHSCDNGKAVLSAQKRAELQMQWNADEAVRKRQFKAVNGLAIGGAKSFIYSPRPQWQYDLWKTIVPFLINNMHLRLKPKELAAKFSEAGPNTITAKMISTPITGAPALNALRQKLKASGKEIPLKKPVSIRSVQKELIALADTATGVETFGLSGEIKGGIAYVAGKTYRIELDRHNHRRIKFKGRYIYLDVMLTT
jgi:hypothetical protein